MRVKCYEMDHDCNKSHVLSNLFHLVKSYGPVTHLSEMAHSNTKSVALATYIKQITPLVCRSTRSESESNVNVQLKFDEILLNTKAYFTSFVAFFFGELAIEIQAAIDNKLIEPGDMVALIYPRFEYKRAAPMNINFPPGMSTNMIVMKNQHPVRATGSKIIPSDINVFYANDYSRIKESHDVTENYSPIEFSSLKNINNEEDALVKINAKLKKYGEVFTLEDKTQFLKGGIIMSYFIKIVTEHEVIGNFHDKITFLLREVCSGSVYGRYFMLALGQKFAKPFHSALTKKHIVRGDMICLVNPIFGGNYSNSYDTEQTYIFESSNPEKQKIVVFKLREMTLGIPKQDRLYRKNESSAPGAQNVLNHVVVTNENNISHNKKLVEFVIKESLNNDQEKASRCSDVEKHQELNPNYKNSENQSDVQFKGSVNECSIKRKKPCENNTPSLYRECDYHSLLVNKPQKNQKHLQNELPEQLLSLYKIIENIPSWKLDVDKLSRRDISVDKIINESGNCKLCSSHAFHESKITRAKETFLQKQNYTQNHTMDSLDKPGPSCQYKLCEQELNANYKSENQSVNKIMNGADKPVLFSTCILPENQQDTKSEKQSDVLFKRPLDKCVIKRKTPCENNTPSTHKVCRNHLSVKPSHTDTFPTCFLNTRLIPEECFFKSNQNHKEFTKYEPRFSVLPILLTKPSLENSLDLVSGFCKSGCNKMYPYSMTAHNHEDLSQPKCPKCSRVLTLGLCIEMVAVGLNTVLSVLLQGPTAEKYLNLTCNKFLDFKEERRDSFVRKFEKFLERNKNSGYGKMIQSTDITSWRYGTQNILVPLV